MSQLDDIVLIFSGNSGLFDEIEFEILEDGTLKIETGQFSPAQHAQAAAFLNKVNEYMGGKVSKQAKMGRRAHTQIKVQHRQG